jgi:hypothetical protein
MRVTTTTGYSMEIKYLGQNVYEGKLLGTNKNVPVIAHGGSRAEVIKELIKWIS